MNINHVTIVGRLTRDPESKALPSGLTVTTFSLATGYTFTRDGKTVEETDYHTIVAFGKLGETSAKFLRKGQLAGVEGRLKTRSWENDGTKHYRTEILADRVQFGPKPGQSEPTERVEPEMPDYPDEEINPEDIPF